jgi:hypothetical protein
MLSLPSPLITLVGIKKIYIWRMDRDHMFRNSDHKLWTSLSVLAEALIWWSSDKLCKNESWFRWTSLWLDQRNMMSPPPSNVQPASFSRKLCIWRRPRPPPAAPWAHGWCRHKRNPVHIWPLQAGFADNHGYSVRATQVTAANGDIHKPYLSVRNIVPTLNSNERWDLPLDGPVLAINDTGFYPGSGRCRTSSSGVLGALYCVAPWCS